MTPAPVLHVLGFPHTQTTSDFLTCAYTQKMVRFCKMMADKGWSVFLYSGDRNDAQGCEHVQLFTEGERLAWFGQGIEHGDFSQATFQGGAKPWRIFNARCVHALLERSEPGDFLCYLGGLAQEWVGAQLPELTAVEFGVGYEGVCDRSWHVYESYAWMHYMYANRGVNDGRWFDAVIPNYFDPADFPDPDMPRPAQEKQPSYGKGEYLLFVGRCINRKGVEVAGQIADRAGMPLVVAGHGASWTGDDGDTLVCQEGGTIGTSGRVFYVGTVGAEGRAELMAGARALLAPTLYIEPFGGVAVEAMMCGTPAITTDWGAFTETVAHGVTGYRFRTLSEAVKAVEMCDGFAAAAEIRERTIALFGMDAVGDRYANHFERLKLLAGDGWAA